MLVCCAGWFQRLLFMDFRLAIVAAYVRSTAIFMRAAVSDRAAKDPGKSTGHVTKNVETARPPVKGGHYAGPEQ